MKATDLIRRLNALPLDCDVRVICGCDPFPDDESEIARVDLREDNIAVIRLSDDFID